MYTELVLKCSIRPDCPQNIKHILYFLFNRGIEAFDVPHISNPPDHEFFKKERWRMIGFCSSYYHVPFSLSRYSENYIFSRSDLKNYSNEIESFLDWLDPYIDEYKGHCIGYKWYEEEEKPTLIFKKNENKNE